MYNHVRRCFVISVNLHRQFLTQSIPTASVSYQNNRANACRPRINAACKRFYCQPVDKSEEERSQEEEISEEETPSETGPRRYEALLKTYEEYQANPETKKRLQILELEVDVLRHNGGKVPEVLKPKDWVALIRLPSKSQRMKLLRFLWRNETMTINQKEEKALKRAEWMAKKESMVEDEEDTGEMKYGLRYNSLFIRIYPTTMTHSSNCKLMQAVMFEPKIVIDCGYEDNMNYRENHNCAKQLQMSFAANRSHINPMHLHYCCLKKGGLLQDFSLVNIPTFCDVDFPATVTSQSYLDLFPKEQLVYLTPHCRMEMTEYDPDLVYIIGAIVDKVQPQPLSLAKAKKEGIRMLKLPVDKYLEWGSGSGKSFTINQMMRIMLDLRHSRDWNVALRNVPTRKLKAARDYMFQRKVSRIAKRLGLDQQEELEESKNTAVPADTQRTRTTVRQRSYSDGDSESDIRDFRFSSRKKNVS